MPSSISKSISKEATKIRPENDESRYSPTRPGGDYDVLLNYRVEDKHQHGETSTAGMIRGAILEADNRDLQISSASRYRSPERYTIRRERSRERSITPFRRQFGISRGDELRYSPYQYTRDRGLGRDERSVTPYRSRRREVSPPETTDSSLSEGKYNQFVAKI